MGDVAIEELFVLVTHAGMGNAEVIIAPNDLGREKEVDGGQVRNSMGSGTLREDK
jgi:hypothetical protein